MQRILKRWTKTYVTPGGFFWHILVFPQRIRRHGFKILLAPLKTREMKKLVEPLRTRQLKKDHLSIVITSAGRKEYLERTIKALRKYLAYDPQKVSWLIIDDYPGSQETRGYIETLDFFTSKVFNKENQGLGYSLNRIFSEIDTEFVFYCQDDFELLRPVPIQDMIAILRHNSHISQLLLAGSKEFADTHSTTRGYQEYYKMFGFWPFLAFTEFFRGNLPFPFYFTNLEFSFYVHKRGWRTSGVFGAEGEVYVRHIGEKRKVWVVK